MARFQIDHIYTKKSIYMMRADQVHRWYTLSIFFPMNFILRILYHQNYVIKRVLWAQNPFFKDPSYYIKNRKIKNKSRTCYIGASQ